MTIIETHKALGSSC